MSTAHSVRLGAGAARARTAARAPGPAVALTWALLLVLLYAAFDHGAGAVAAGARIDGAVAAIAAATAAGILWTGSLRFSAPRRAMVAVGLLAAFAVWSGISIAWSVAPNQTWLELNRAISYALVLALAVTVGASHARSIEFAAGGFLLVTLAVALYGLGQKVLPGVHLTGVFDLDQTAVFPRLQQPFGYWNALALFIAMGVPVALALAVDKARTARIRMLGLLSVQVLLLTLAMTYSRGGVLALVIGLAAGIAVSGARLRSLMWIGLAAVAAVPPVVVALSAHTLTTAFIPLSARERVGAELGGLLVVSMVALWLVGSRLTAVERRVQVGPERGRRIGHLVALLVSIVLACGVVGVALSPRGLTGTVSHAWSSFIATKGTSVYNPDRLLSVDSENRWVWWKEAVQAFSDRPVGGWGAGSFAVVHLLYRRNTLSVTEAHNVPLQLLAETGIVGALLAVGAFGLLLAGGAAGVRRRPLGGERLLAAALLAGAVTYAIHACYDWDWDIPGVTLPALLLLGVLAGASRNRRRAAPEPAALASGPGVRALALGFSALALCTFAVSGALPSLAAGRARNAIVAAGRSTPAGLASAQSSAELATSLDPLSDAGLLVEAAIADQRGRLGLARSDLLTAVGRDPTDPEAWEQLLLIEIRLGNIHGAITAAARELALDPSGAAANELAQRTATLAAPPSDSPTAIRTPAS